MREFYRIAKTITPREWLGGALVFGGFAMLTVAILLIA